MAKTKEPKASKPPNSKEIKSSDKKSKKGNAKTVEAVAPVGTVVASSDECAGFTPSGNIFQDVVSNPKCAQEVLMGPMYPYWKNVRSPSEMGMSDKGTIDAMTKDINGLVNYVELLVAGTGKASKTGKPLGNKFFLKTGAKCMDKNNKEQERYVYINNVPLGNIPFMSSGMGSNFKTMRGLLPGTMSNLSSMNPLEIMQGFMEGGSPPCQKVTLQTINSDNKTSKETHYMTTLDIKTMDPCAFIDGKNPITKKKCKQAFGNINEYYNDNDYSSDDDSDHSNDDLKKHEDIDDTLSLPQDPIVQIYFACLGILGIYMLYRIMSKSKR